MSETSRSDWLSTLVVQHRMGLILPGGMVWETPPPVQVRNELYGVRARRYRGARRGRAVGPPVPTMPIDVREAVHDVLRRNPGRWARVATGDLCSILTVCGWFDRQKAGGVVAVTIRNRGLTVAVYARFIAEDVLAPAGGMYR